MTDPISRMSSVARVLEDRFYFAESVVLKEQLARLKNESESVNALGRVSGLTNKAVLAELVILGIRPEMLAALCLVPIIEVAWADGIIERNEIKAVLNGAQKHGFGEDNPILREWLQRKPDTALLTAWRTYMQGLCETLGKEALANLKAEILEHTKMVAVAAGGFLGLTNQISKEEQRVLDDIGAFFKAPGPCCP